ncbi:hypothetical protein [Acidiphilium iwatense]|nr:hypothetical protein [Acidiphilium iwatense]
MVLRLDVMAIGHMSVMAGFVMNAGLSVLSSLKVVFCRFLVMMRRQVMMFAMGVIAHGMTSYMISVDDWCCLESAGVDGPR